MQELIIDEEFRTLLPELDSETYALLEESILENGCIFPLVVWGDILIDGFNRYNICMEHGIPFDTVSKTFNVRDDVMIWIIANQVSRRNLSPLQLSYYRGLHYAADKRLVMKSHGRNQYTALFRQNDGIAKTQPTAARLAEKYRVSPRTIERDAKIAEAINVLGATSPDAKRSVLSGATSITKKQLSDLLSGSEEDIVDIAAKLKDGTFERRRTASQVSDKGDSCSDPGETGQLPLAVTVRMMTDVFLSELCALSGNATAEELRTALKSHIVCLEELLGQI